MQPRYHYLLPRVYPGPAVGADVKSCPGDFIVEERIDISLAGEGEHDWLYIEKRLLNTDEVATRLARLAKVRTLAVGYAGLKDKQAVTRQWFSVQLPGRASPDWRQLEDGTLRVLDQRRHHRKLQRGALQANRFRLRLRRLRSMDDGGSHVETLHGHLRQRCQQLAVQGVPNYFGRQRFGRDMNNLDQAERLFSQTGARRRKLRRHQRSLYLSSARAWLFNQILAERVRQCNWNRHLDGDVFMLDGKSACFSDDGSVGLDHRLEAGSIHPTAPLWGEGDAMSRGECACLENRILDQYPVLAEGLVAAGLKVQRRALRLMPSDLDYSADGEDAVLCFTLPAGAYATVVLDELLTATPAPAGG